LLLKTGFRSQRDWNELIDYALSEDGAWLDRTSFGLTSCQKKVYATIFSKQELILAGLDIAAQTFHRLSDSPIIWMTECSDGKKIKIGQPIARIEAEAWVILAAERTALNFIQRLSGVATLTKQYVDRIAGTRARIVDTRKTTPGMRILEKYAVRCGGGLNHRFGLNDGCLIKDNHIQLVGGIKKAVEMIRRNIPHIWRIEVEVETLEQVEECLRLGIEAVLLDNMPIPVIAEAVKMIKGKMLVEASGGISLENVLEIAQTGVDLISIGALTHSAPAVDVSLELD
jgi:nicotinate-nucleotide pyrophosphorylase (carboxylating)